MRCTQMIILILLILPLAGNTEPAFVEELQQLKQASLSLDRDLILLEEEITQPLSIYLTLETDSRFVLEKLVLRLDNRSLLSQQYSEEQRKALAEGGAQLLFKGELPAGQHQLIAYYQSDKGYQSGKEYRFVKTDSSLIVEIRIQKTNFKESRLHPVVKIGSVKGVQNAN